MADADLLSAIRGVLEEQADWKARCEARIRALRPSRWLTEDARFILERLDEARTEIERLRERLKALEVGGGPEVDFEISNCSKSTKLSCLLANALFDIARWQSTGTGLLCSSPRPPYQWRKGSMAKLAELGLVERQLDFGSDRFPSYEITQAGWERYRYLALRGVE